MSNRIAGQGPAVFEFDQMFLNPVLEKLIQSHWVKILTQGRSPPYTFFIVKGLRLTPIIMIRTAS
jgi:hypothetical protein